MFRAMKFFHIMGTTLFLGSIFTFIVVSAQVQGASLDNLVFGRQVIGAGTWALTLPGICVTAATGIWMGYKRFGLTQRFCLIKLLLTALIAVNGFFFVVPAVLTATEAAVQSRALGHLLPTYDPAYLKESIFGSINILAALAASIVGVWKIGAKGSHKGEPKK